ncbi:UDP-GalNAc:beta-1,3-N-acetylgalactosaminyltransferase 2-like [Amphibalanus amphitrite]|uniref:UDP-GalNAc:beta-1, 3-N-acetylgalactosaminyltransferase 2-like n=1 Tax=Amphibalanus amphitrite TaxID=1232801 RepID=UPI001C8FBB7F|nr:UDP-GalNAc:beta-1,3-N-acetylgalactosaminyltransferase 2-like [Amphibalanus amphitrite]
MLSKKLGITCVIATVSAVFASYFFQYSQDDPADPHNTAPGGRLVVGVLSGRRRRQQRDAIRDTWWPQLEAAGARGVFVVGGSDCPLVDRCLLDRYSCEPWRPPRNAVGSQQQLRLTPGPVPRPAAVGIAFTVLRGVVARAVTSPLHSGDVTLETADGEPAAAAAVGRSPVTSEAASSDVKTALSPLLVLPAGFMGRLRVVSGPGVMECRQTEVPEPTELRVTALITEDGRHVRPGLEPLCWPVALVYTVHDEPSAADPSPAPSDPLDDPTCRRTDGDAVTRSLSEEAARHGDLLLVPGPDVYRRLPDKLISFLTWAAETPAQWVIKCDDDVLLDIPRILENVPPHTDEGLWWGQFRYNWPADRYGKWAELEYQAAVYPPFACGTASLLSADVVRWLARNRAELTRFQGEDVSLGIWLAGHRVRRLSDPGWACGDAERAAYSRGQLGPARLRRVWRCLRRNSRLELCGEEGEERMIEGREEHG